MEALDPSIVTDSVAQQIAERIRSAIAEGRLKPDQQLPSELELASMYGVSRPTVREALKRLAAQNLVRSKRGPAGGTFVHSPSLDEAVGSFVTQITLLMGLGAFDLDQINEVRLQLGTLCCTLAAERRTDDDLASLRAELRLQAGDGLDGAELCMSDLRFHRTLAAATHNPLLQLLLYPVVDSLQPVANLVAHPLQDRKALMRQHKAVVDALEARDAGRAQQALMRAIAHQRSAYAAALEQFNARRAPA